MTQVEEVEGPVEAAHHPRRSRERWREGEDPSRAGGQGPLLLCLAVSGATSGFILIPGPWK